MRRNLVKYLLLLLPLMIACTEESLPTPELRTAEARYLIPYTASELEIVCEVVNPRNGVVVTANPQEEWIEVGESTAEGVVLRITENPGPRRVGAVTLHYGDWAQCPIEVVQLACNSDADGIADQTVLFHLSGQSLYTYFKNFNVADIRSAIDEHILYQSRLLVYTQPTSYDSYLVEYSFDYRTQASRADTLRHYEGMNSIQTEGIVRVIRDAVKLAPADRYGMVLGSHGAGWVPAIYDSLRESEDSKGDDIWQSCDRHWDWLHKSPGADATRWFGEHNGETTDLKSWVDAFTEVAPESGEPLMEYLIFDACFMSNIEALYELRHAARYILASPCEIMGRGMPYDLTLPYLFTDEGRSYNLQGFAEAFVNYYALTTDTRPSGCLALCCCEELEPLAEATRRVNEGAIQSVDRWALQNYEGLIRPLFQDFRQYIELLCADPTLLTEFLAQFDRTFPPSTRLHTAEFYSGYNGDMNPITYYSGVSTSAASDKYPTAYVQTPWALATTPVH